MKERFAMTLTIPDRVQLLVPKPVIGDRQIAWWTKNSSMADLNFAVRNVAIFKGVRVNSPEQIRPVIEGVIETVFAQLN